MILNPLGSTHFEMGYLKNVYCVNCGEQGHVIKTCVNPITSFGIIAYKYTPRNIGCTNAGIQSDLDQTSFKKNNVYINPCSSEIRFLMIQRKDTIGYIDFIRGKYSAKNSSEELEKIKLCLGEITKDERVMLLTRSFDEIWENMWVNKKSQVYKNEYNLAKYKYQKLDIPKLLEQVPCVYSFNEWGFPKGRRNIKETNLTCAQREFFEETGYNKSWYHSEHTPVVEESFIGTNGVEYRHVYFIVEMNPDAPEPFVDPDNILQIGEVKNIGWINTSEALALLRPYDTAKKDAIEKAHAIINSIKTNITDYYETIKKKYIAGDVFLECAFPV